MPIALDPKESFEYVLEDERKLAEDEQTFFTLRGLTIAEETSLSNSILASQMGGDEMMWKTGDYQLKTLKLGMIGWRNFKDSSGAEVPFVSVDKSKHGRRVEPGITHECLDRLSATHRTEIANAIGNRGKVTAEEGN